MSVQRLLTERLAEPEGILKHTEGMSPNERLFVQLREAEATVKNAEEDRDKLKAEARRLVEDGEMVGSVELGHYELGEPAETVTFDYRKAAMNGLFTLKDIEPYMTRKPKQRSLLFKKPEKA